jgi:Cellulase (glycosyl hydrolase family 5).
MENHLFYRTFSILFIGSLLFISTSCNKENPILSNNPAISNELPYLKGMLVAWNERMKTQGSHVKAGSPEEAWFTLTDVTRMKKAGANCLEIHQLGLPDLMPERNVPNESFFTNRVDVWVDWCTQNQMYCILNIQGLDAEADWAFYLGMPSWLWEGMYATPSYTNKAGCDSIIRDFFDLDIAKQDANRAAFITLWKFIANRYKNNPYVMLSIMNEPFWAVDIPDEAAAIHLGQSYSTYMEQLVDAIRTTGAAQKVIIDLPFLWDHNWRFTVKPVNRDNIVWEAHMYGNMWEPKLEPFKSNLNGLVQLFVHEFGKPLFIGEYGINPMTSIRTNNGSNWKSIISGEVAYLDSLPLLGRQFVSWDNMNGEYAAFSGESDLTAEESEWIMKTVLTDK